MIHFIFYKIYALFFSLFFKIYFSPTVLGKGNIPRNGRVILVANHSNNLDFISMGIGTKRNIHFMAKNSLFKGILSLVMKSVGAISIDRSKKNNEAMNKAKHYLEKENIVGIFPEGTFNKTNECLAEFKMGAVSLARKTNAPIVPIAIIGEYKRGKLKIVIGRPIYVRSDDLVSENDKLRKRLERILRGINWK